MAKTRLKMADLQGFRAKRLTRQTPKTEIPDSLQNMAPVAKKTVQTKNGLFCPFLTLLVDFWYCSNVNRADRKKIPARISARPTIPATASV